MSDQISRQAAIDALADYIHNVDKVIGTGKLSTADCRDAAESVLEDLPSAQPEIIRCKDCEWFDESYPLGTYADGVFRCNRVKMLWMEKDAFCSYGERRGGNG